MLPVPLCMSLSLCWSCCKLWADGLSEPVTLSLTALPSWPGDAVILMLPMGTLLLTILVRSCVVSGCTRSSVVVLAYLSCFYCHLPIHTMLPLRNAC